MNNRNRNNNSDRVTVTLDRKVYDHLKSYGKMGDTFSMVIDKILREKEGSEMNSVNGGSW
jgi:predicted CopG family antitoxin